METKYSMMALRDTFISHMIKSKQENERFKADFIRDYPDDPLPDHMLDDFSLPEALAAMCYEILKIKNRLDGSEKLHSACPSCGSEAAKYYRNDTETRKCMSCDNLYTTKHEPLKYEWCPKCHKINSEAFESSSTEPIRKCLECQTLFTT